MNSYTMSYNFDYHSTDDQLKGNDNLFKSGRGFFIPDLKLKR